MACFKFSFPHICAVTCVVPFTANRLLYPFEFLTKKKPEARILNGAMHTSLQLYHLPSETQLPPFIQSEPADWRFAEHQSSAMACHSTIHALKWTRTPSPKQISSKTHSIDKTAVLHGMVHRASPPLLGDAAPQLLDTSPQLLLSGARDRKRLLENYLLCTIV